MEEHIEDVEDVIEDPMPDFWDRITIPLNYEWEEDNTEFVNPVTVADKFAEAAGIGTFLGQDAENITKHIANAEYQRKEVQREIYKLRRRLLADNYSKVTKSAPPLVQDAFILSVARSGGVEQELLELEDRLDELTSIIDMWTPHLEQNRFRMKTLEKNMEWIKQWLDFEKLMERLTESKRF